MKKIALAFAIVILSLEAYSQWEGSSPGNIYYNTANVGIGTPSPSEKLHLSGSGIIKSLVESSDNHAYYVVEGAAGKGSFIDYYRKGDGRIWHTGLRGANNNFEFRSNDQNTILALQQNGNIGIGTAIPETNFHVSHSDIGIKSQSAVGVIEADDAQLDITSSADQTWGSAINLIEGNGSSNTDVWSMVRQTTSGPGNSSLRFNFGTDNSHVNPNIVTFNANGNIGIGTEAPETSFHVSHSDIGIKSQSAVGIIEADDAQLDITSNADQTWGSAINLIEGNGGSNTDVWSIVRQTTNGTGNSSLRFNFGTDNSHVNPNIVTFNANGNIGIGTANPTQKLEVAGTIRSREVKVELAAGTGPDYVFEPDYELRTLEETKKYIEENKHLPEIPSAKEMEANGIEIGDMNMRLLKKIEELTLHQIELLERLETQRERISELEKKVN